MQQAPAAGGLWVSGSGLCFGTTLHWHFITGSAEAKFSPRCWSFSRGLPTSCGGDGCRIAKVVERQHLGGIGGGRNRAESSNISPDLNRKPNSLSRQNYLEFEI